MTAHELTLAARVETCEVRERRGLHVAIIMDGNGRWATRRGLPRLAGHKTGAQAVRRIVRAACAAPDVGTLTLYAFSSDNWRRPAEETSALMRLLRLYLARETVACVRNGIRLTVIGRRDRLAPELRTLVARTEARTRAGRNLHLRLAIDYSARDAILRAADAWRMTEERDEGELADDARAQRAASSELSRERFAELLGGASGNGDVLTEGEAVHDVDLLIRTGGEQRLSDFLLWECAYAELMFTPVMFPDFDGNDLQAALAEFNCRERRFGATPAASERNGTHRGVWSETVEVKNERTMKEVRR